MQEMARLAKGDIYIQVRLFEFVTKFKFIESDKARHVQSNDLSMVRVHYFFTLPNAPIHDLINDTEIEIRITDGPSYSKNEPLAVGKLFALRNFKNIDTYRNRD